MHVAVVFQIWFALDKRHVCDCGFRTEAGLQRWHCLIHGLEAGGCSSVLSLWAGFFHVGAWLLRFRSVLADLQRLG